MGLLNAFRNWMNCPIIEKLKEIENIMATDKAALDQALKDLGDAITSEDAGITAIEASVATLVAAVKSNPGQPVSDFTDEINALASMTADSKSQLTNIQSSIATATGATTPTTGS